MQGNGLSGLNVVTPMTIIRVDGIAQGVPREELEGHTGAIVQTPHFAVLAELAHDPNMTLGGIGAFPGMREFFQVISRENMSYNISVEAIGRGDVSFGTVELHKRVLWKGSRSRDLKREVQLCQIGG